MLSYAVSALRHTRKRMFDFRLYREKTIVVHVGELEHPCALGRLAQLGHERFIGTMMQTMVCEGGGSCRHVES